MRMVRAESSGLGGKIAIGVAALLILAVAGLATYGGIVSPKPHTVEQVLSNDRFQN